MANPLNLNKPIDAREYLERLEARGTLDFDEPITVSDLCDDECLIAASICFQKLVPVVADVLQ